MWTDFKKILYNFLRKFFFKSARKSLTKNSEYNLRTKIIPTHTGLFPDVFATLS